MLWIGIDTAEILRFYFLYPEWNLNKRDVVAHETGHATPIVHHSDIYERYGDVVYQWISPGTVVPGLGTWYGRQLCGYQLPEQFFVGKAHNRMSGDETCIMRYPNPPRCVYPQLGVLFECAPSFIDAFDFCRTARGSSFNAGHHCAGRAIVGNCRGQLQVNDRQ